MRFENNVHYFNTVKKAIKNRGLILLNDRLEKLKEVTDVIYDMSVGYRYDIEKRELYLPVDAFLYVLRETEDLDNLNDLNRLIDEITKYLKAIIRISKDENFDPNNYKEIYLHYHRPSQHLNLSKIEDNLLDRWKVVRLLTMIRQNDYVVDNLFERFNGEPSSETDVCQLNRMDLLDVLAEELRLPDSTVLFEAVGDYLKDKPFKYEDSASDDKPIVVDDFLALVKQHYLSHTESGQPSQ